MDVSEESAVGGRGKHECTAHAAHAPGRLSKAEDKRGPERPANHAWGRNRQGGQRAVGGARVIAGPDGLITEHERVCALSIG